MVDSPELGDSGEEDQMKIQIDVDGVLADFLKGATDLAKTLDPTIIPFDTLTATHWDQWKSWPEDTKRKMWKEIKLRPSFFCDLPSLISQEEMVGLKLLRKPGNELYFVTSRPGESSKWQTEQWIWDRMGFMPTVVMTRDKGGFARLIKTDFSIEDNADNAIEIGQVIGPSRSFIIHRLYNQHMNPIFATRVKTFKEFLGRVNVTSLR